MGCKMGQIGAAVGSSKRCSEQCNKDFDFAAEIHHSEGRKSLAVTVTVIVAVIAAKATATAGKLARLAVGFHYFKEHIGSIGVKWLGKLGCFAASKDITMVGDLNSSY